jgi:tetratricopeptide (TPR) repeat protein
MFKNKPNPEKALKLEKKGDKLLEKGKFRKALAQYQKSEALNPERKEIYEKMNKALSGFEHEWSEEDFSNSMGWAMKLQELQNPQMKRVHEKFSAEYHEVQKLVQRLMVAVDAELELQLVEKIIAYGDKAHLPVLDYLLSIKALASRPSEAQESPDQTSPDPVQDL